MSEKLTRAGTERRVHFFRSSPLISPKRGGGGVERSVQSFVSGRLWPPSRLRPLPCHFRTSAGEEKVKRKGQSIPSHLQRPQPHPSRALRIHLPSRRTSPGCLQSQNHSRPSGFTHSSSSPGRAWVPVFKYPSLNCDGGGDSSWKPGLSPLPPWPAPGCPRAPWPERNVEPPGCPLPSWPLGAVSVHRHACARISLYTHEPRVRG